MARKIVARTGFTVANDSYDCNQVGSIMDGLAGNQYRYVQVEDADLAVNEVVTFADATGSEVTNDRSGGSSLGKNFAGVALNTVKDGNFGWVQIKGLATCKVYKGKTIAAGNRVIIDSVNDGCVVSTSSATFSFGMALGADTATTSSNGTVAVMIDL